MIEPSPQPPEYVLVVCPVCRARLHPTVKSDARKVTCPDCFVAVRVPSLEEVLRRQEEEARHRPKPEEIEPYPLALPDAPPKDPREDAGRCVTVRCGVCTARLTPLVEDRPRTIVCPDCYEDVRVPGRAELPPPPKKKRRKTGTYQAGPAPVEPRPVYTEVADAQAEVREEPLPEPPRWTFFSGTFTFPWRKEAVGRWACLAAGFTFMGLVVAFLHWVGAGLVAMGFFALPMIWLGVLTFSYASAWALPVIVDTSAGNDRVSSWPDANWRDAAGQLAYVGFLAIVAQVMAYGLGKGFEAAAEGGGWWVSLAGFFVLYPVVLLSSLEANCFWIPLTMPIVRSLVRLWWGWLVFYALTALLGAAWLGLVWFGFSDFPFLTALAAGPLAAAGVLIYARLLGRLAWRAAAADAREDEPGPKPPSPPEGPAPLLMQKAGEIKEEG